MASVLGIHHVAFAHSGEISLYLKLTTLLGLPDAIEEEADGFIERMTPVGECFLQTLESTGPGVVQRFLERRGPALHHVALRVEGLPAMLNELTAKGIELVDARPRRGALDSQIAFIHPRAFDGLLLELVEDSESVASESDVAK